MVVFKNGITGYRHCIDLSTQIQQASYNSAPPKEATAVYSYRSNSQIYDQCYRNRQHTYQSCCGIVLSGKSNHYHTFSTSIITSSHPFHFYACHPNLIPQFTIEQPSLITICFSQATDAQLSPETAAGKTCDLIPSSKHSIT